MKTTKLFFAMAMAASLIACTKDVLVEPEKAVESFDEIKGAKLLATGFSLDPTSDQTKVMLDAEGTPQWEIGDKIGVAWYVGAEGEVDAPQGTVTLDKLSSTAYANHKLTYGLNEKGVLRFLSNSNVYEGWHVPYFPYHTMAKPGPISFTVNPDMPTISNLDDYKLEEYKNGIQISAGMKLTTEDVVDGVIQKDAKLKNILNVIRPKFAVAEDIQKSEAFGSMMVESITITTNRRLFAETITLNPQYFRTEVDAEGNIVPKAFSEDDYNENPGVAFQTSRYKASITTTLDKEAQKDYTLNTDGKLNFRVLMVPARKASGDAALDQTYVTVTMTNESFFKIEYDSEAGEKDINNKTLKKLVALLNNAGWKPDDADAETKEKTLRKLEATPFSLDFELRKEDFHTEYVVKDLTTWEQNVNLAKAKGETDPTFYISGSVEFPEEVYIGAVEGEGALNSITVSPKDDAAAVLVFKEATTWPSQIKPSGNVTISVGETGVLTLNSRLGSRRISNDGRIVILGGNNMKATSGITNNGTIEVTIGSEFEKSTVNGEGTVVYYVEGDAAENPEKVANIDDLISKANLTNLVVNNDWTVKEAASWPDLAVELNNADVTFAAGADVNSITVTGESSITGNVDGDVIVGKEPVVETRSAAATTMATLKANEIGTLTVNEGAEATLTSDYSVKIGEITNNGTLNVNTDVFVAGNITTKVGSTIVVDPESGVYYGGKFIQKGSSTGTIEKDNAPAEDPAEGYYVANNGTYVVRGNEGLSNALDALTEEDVDATIALEANVTLSTNGKYGVDKKTNSITILGNGNTITFNPVGETDQNYIKTENNAKLIIQDATIAKTAPTNDTASHAHELKFDCEVEFTNVIFNNTLQFAGNATLTNVAINGNDDSKAEHRQYAIWVPHYGQEINLINCVINASRGIKIEEELFTAKDAAQVKLNVENTKFTTEKKSAILIHAAAGAMINWDGENNIDGVKADTCHPVWFDAAAGVGYDKNLVVKVDGVDKTAELVRNEPASGDCEMDDPAEEE